MTRFVMAVAAAHTAVVIAHGAAHVGLGVLASPAESVFIALCIYLAPAAAGLIAWRARGPGSARAAAALLSASLAGSLLFGLHHHFVAISSDHVGHLPPGGWRLVFQLTAVLAALVDAVGVVGGLVSLRASALQSQDGARRG